MSETMQELNLLKKIFTTLVKVSEETHATQNNLFSDGYMTAINGSLRVIEHRIEATEEGERIEKSKKS